MTMPPYARAYRGSCDLQAIRQKPLHPQRSFSVGNTSTASVADYHMPIIFITGHGDIPMSVEAMKKGAIDFLTKPFDDKELLQAVEKAIEKDTYAKAEYDETLDIRRRIDGLTPRELEVLSYVITGMLNKQIALKLDIAEKTIKVHRGRIMEKLCVASVADLVRLAGKAGIEPTEST
jgi:two-component system response regulator FixJ